MAFTNPTPRWPVVKIDDPHEYTDGLSVQYEHLTGLLRDEAFSGDVAKWATEAHRNRGKFIHGVNELLAEGDDADDDSIPEAWMGYVTALRKFYSDNRHRLKVEACEIPLAVPHLGYACTPDLVGFCGPERGVWELKTGTSEGVAYQVGGQIIAWTENFSDRPIAVAYCVKLSANGTYRVNQIDARKAVQDFGAIIHVRRMRERRA